MPRIIKGRAVTIDEGNVYNPEISSIFNSIKIAPEEPKTEAPEEHAARIIKKAKLEAEDIIDDANRKAAKIEEDAKKNSARDIEAAFKSNREKGYAEGYDKGVKESEVLKNKAQNELDSAIAERKRMQEQLEPEIFDLMSSILEKIFGVSNAINPQIIIYLIKQGLSEATKTGNLIIKVSAADYETVMENKESIVAESSADLEIIKDLSLKESDCIIETPFGNIDASLNHQFETLKTYLKFIFDNR